MKINVKKLEEKASKLYRELNKIRHTIELYTTIPKAKALVGKCFRYTNSYGGDTRPWPLYVRVLSTEDGTLICESFQTDCYGKFEFTPTETHYVHSLDRDSYVEIPESVYAEQKEVALGKL